mmetsp:Transcript_15524/g.33675  ORF Transcript_15524/g.33675 Transcript_15524/m.33675 type:complete len:211 (+) Transcript_15524:1217-1849(+)
MGSCCTYLRGFDTVRSPKVLCKFTTRDNGLAIPLSLPPGLAKFPFFVHVCIILVERRCIFVPRHLLGLGKIEKQPTGVKLVQRRHAHLCDRVFQYTLWNNFRSAGGLRQSLLQMQHVVRAEFREPASDVQAHLLHGRMEPCLSLRLLGLLQLLRLLLHQRLRMWMTGRGSVHLTLGSICERTKQSAKGWRLKRSKLLQADSHHFPAKAMA